MTEPWNGLAFTAAINRLSFWQKALEEAKLGNDSSRMLEAKRFVDEYEKLISDMKGLKPPTAS